MAVETTSNLFDWLGSNLLWVKENIENVEALAGLLQKSQTFGDVELNSLKQVDHDKGMFLGFLLSKKLLLETEKLVEIEKEIIKSLEESKNFKLLHNFKNQQPRQPYFSSLPSYKSVSSVGSEHMIVKGTDTSFELQAPPTKKVKLNDGQQLQINNYGIENAEPEFAKRLQYIKRIGEGGFGCVVKAIDPTDQNKAYAVKVIKWDHKHTKSHENNKNATRELKILQDLSNQSMGHKFVVRSMGYNFMNSTEDIKQYLPKKWHNVSDHVRLYMECCDMSLSEWIRIYHKEPQYYCEAIQLFVQMVHILEFLHSKENGIIHRDLKPENLLINKRGDSNYIVKAGDFGLARNTVGSKAFTRGLGTLWYMSPEQKLGSTYDTKTDIFSLGKILIELLNPIYDLNDPSTYFTRLDKMSNDPGFRFKYPIQGILHVIMTEENQDERLNTDDLVIITQYHIEQNKSTELSRSFEQIEDADEDKMFDCISFLKNESIKSIFLANLSTRPMDLLSCVAIQHITLTTIKLLNIVIDANFPAKIYLPNLTEFACDIRIDTDTILNDDYEETVEFLNQSKPLVDSLIFFKKDIKDQDTSHDINDCSNLQCNVEVSYDNEIIVYAQHYPQKELRLSNVSYLNREHLIRKMGQLERLTCYGSTLNPSQIPYSLKELYLLRCELSEVQQQALGPILGKLSLLEVLKIDFKTRGTLNIQDFPVGIRTLCLGSIDLVISKTCKLSNLGIFICDDCDISIIQDLNEMKLLKEFVLHKCICNHYVLIEQALKMVNVLIVEINNVSNEGRGTIAKMILLEIKQLDHKYFEVDFERSKMFSLSKDEKQLTWSVNGITKKSFEKQLDDYFSLQKLTASGVLSSNSDEEEDETDDEMSEDSNEETGK